LRYGSLNSFPKCQYSRLVKHESIKYIYNFHLVFVSSTVTMMMTA